MSARSTAAEPPCLRGSRILLAEDDEVSLLLACEMLECAEAVVTVARDGAAAVRAALAGDFDAVLMDLEMPVMGGTEAAARIREDPRLGRLPIIAMSAEAVGGAGERPLAAGLDDFIRKPFMYEDLVALLLAWHEPSGPCEGEAESRCRDRARVGARPGLELDGIDVGSGLDRVLGDEELYREMLGAFASGYSGMMERLDSAMARRDLDDAMRAAHTVRGSSANIGAYPLSGAAAALQAALKAGASPSAELEDFRRELERVLSSLSALG